tara:strand:+ start:40903 stop:41322 length:420 start_codon:yes stop_codon:yes gene_type:complete
MEINEHLKKYVLSVVLILLTGCAATYHPAEGGPSGYRDAHVKQNIYYVEYTESAKTDWATIHRFTLKRCAEIAKENGYLFFDVLHKDEKTVYLESAVDQIIVANMGNIGNEPPTANVYSTAGKRVEGRRVTYKIKLLNE